MSDVFEMNENIKVDEPKEKGKREKVKKPITEERKSVLIKQLKDARERKRLLREGNKKEPVKEVVKEPVKVVKEPVNLVKEPVNLVKKPVNVVKEPVNIVKEPVKNIPKPVMPNNIENVKSPEFNRNIVSNPIEIPKALPPVVIPYNLFTNNKKMGFWVN